MKSVKPTDAHRAFRDSLIRILKRHSGHLPAEEMLALAAHAVGQIIAYQDQRTMTTDRAMEIVTANIEQGNAEAMEELLKVGGTAQ